MEPGKTDQPHMNEDHGTSDTYLTPGTQVRYDGLVDGGPEYGVVVHCWYEPEIYGHDCYVAFFGPEMPSGQPSEKPYILRYAASSLVPVMDAG